MQSASLRTFSARAALFAGSFATGYAAPSLPSKANQFRAPTFRMASSAPGGERTKVQDAVTIEAAPGKQDASIIFLHGLGDTGDGWLSLMPEIDKQLPKEYAGKIRYICPHAPTMPISLNGGMAMPGWFDIYGLGPDDKEDAANINAASERVQALVQDEIDAGIRPDRIVVGGFSQGGSIALQTALRSPVRLAGCVALSTWLSLRDEYPAALGPHAKALPLLQAHGSADMTVSPKWGQMSHELIKGWKDEGSATWIVAPGVAHGVDMMIISEVAEFVAEVLKE